MKKSFPEFNLLDYDRSMRETVVFFDANVSNASRKDITIEYWKGIGKDVEVLSHANDSWFLQVGILANLAQRGISLEDTHTRYLENKYAELVTMSKKYAEPVIHVAPKPRPVVSASKYIGELEGMIDEFVRGGSPDVRVYITKNDLNATVSGDIAKWFRRRNSEIKMAIGGTDIQLNEGYSNFTRPRLKKLSELMDEIIAACGVSASMSKVRSPKSKKVKAPSAIVKGVKYLKECPPLKLKSIAPEKMVNTNEIWLFNTKTRKLFKYLAINSGTMSIKGSTIIGFDPEKSGSKIIRKPETQLDGVEKFTSRPINALYSSIRSTVGKATGRINEDVIILKAF